MHHTTLPCLALCIALAVSAAHAKDSDASASFRPRGASETDARVTAPAPPATKPGALTDRAFDGPVGAEHPAASDVPPARTDGTQNTLQAGNLFTLRVCNRSSTSARVAVTRREEGGSGWRVEGWWRVAPSDCENLGVFPRGWVYYYADATDGGAWTGQAVRKCVRYPGPFTRYEGGGNYACSSNERLKSFAGTFVEDEVATHTWNLNP